MSTRLNAEQQPFYEELVSFGIPDAVAAILAIKTNWQEIIYWDEHRQLKKLATLIWQTGLTETSAQATKMAKRIKTGGLNIIFNGKSRKTAGELDIVGNLLPDLAVDGLAELGNEEMTVIWLKVRQLLETKLATTGLTADENNYLVIAIFYTS